MQPGSMLYPVFMMLLFGWMYTEARHKSDFPGLSFVPMAIALGILFAALIDGAYWSIFPPANYYPVDDWRFLGLTRNKWAAIGIGIGVFFLPEMFWQVRGRISPGANLKALHPTPECTIAIWPRSGTAEVRVRNMAKGPIKVSKVAAVDSIHHELKLDCDASLVDRHAGHLETITAQYRANSWYPPPQVWVHGEHINGLPWSCRCKPKFLGPDAPRGFLLRSARPLALAAVIGALFIAGVAISTQDSEADYAAEALAEETTEAPAEEAYEVGMEPPAEELPSAELENNIPSPPSNYRSIYADQPLFDREAYKRRFRENITPRGLSDEDQAEVDRMVESIQKRNKRDRAIDDDTAEATAEETTEAPYEPVAPR